MTKRAKPVFTVKEYSDGKPWLAIEYATSDQDFPLSFGLDLKVGTTYNQAKEIAHYLNEHVTDFTFTD